MPRTTPDEWAARNRVYPASAGIPGPRNPKLTPYVIPFGRAVLGGAHKRVVLVTGAQSGKTDSALDLIGCRLDQRPAPIIYVGPSREFLTDQFEPRLMALLDQAASLARKVVRGRRMKKTRKIVAGVSVRLAHAGSSTALKSDPAALAIVDEYDEMLANVRGQGDPLGLVEARGFTFADFCAAITSTPSRGLVDTEIDARSGLEFWKLAEAQDLESGIWKLFQEGTRYHWTWPCPECGGYFIPRFKQLRWPEKATPAEAKRNAWLECPHCGSIIEDAARAAMNARGVFVAPGQWVGTDGTVHGEPPDTSTCSMWVSGLASPFVTLGERAEAYLKALASGEDDKVQTAINAGFGECYAAGLAGDALDWKEVAAKRVPYRTGEVPRGVLRLTAGVDVQARSLYYVIRGWGAQARSWLIDYGQLFGPTHEDAVWDELLAILTRPYDGLVVEKAMIDSGFRPGKAGSGDDHAVYEFTRRHHWLCLPTKGHDRLPTPIRASQIEVTAKGQRAPRSQTLWHLDSDFFKSLVHSRLKIEHGRPGAFYLPEDASDDYCQQLVSEWRTISPDNAKAYWVVRNRNNHMLDCFDPETELLTLDGWISVADAKHGTSFATVNLATDKIEYQQPLGVISRHHAGEMVRIKGRVVDLLVTPNHRMVTYRYGSGPNITLAGNLDIWHRLKRTANWDGKTMEAVHFPPSWKEPERSVDAGDWMEFLGWYVADGHRARCSDRYRMVILSKYPGPKQDRLLALLARLPWRHRMVSKRQIAIPSVQLFDALNECYNPSFSGGRGCYHKRLPALAKSAPPELIARLLDAAILGDGWTQRGFRTYATTSRRLADDLQELFIKTGNSACVRRRAAQPCRMRGQELKTVDQFHVSEIKTKAVHLRRADNSSLVSRVSYDGMVHCVSVPNGTLIVRRNGLPMVVGNCEALAASAAYMLRVHTIPDGVLRELPAPPPEAPAVDGPEPQKSGIRSRFAGLAARANR